jgi:hypothetical protein
MMKVLRGRPRPGTIIAVLALVLAMAGTAVAAGGLGLGALTDGAKNKTVGVGKLTYVTTNTNIPFATTTPVAANCPAGLSVIGGGVKWGTPVAPNTVVTESGPSTAGWNARVYSEKPGGNTATTTAICAKSRVVTGAPPAP